MPNGMREEHKTQHWETEVDRREAQGDEEGKERKKEPPSKSGSGCAVLFGAFVVVVVLLPIPVSLCGLTTVITLASAPWQAYEESQSAEQPSSNSCLHRPRLRAVVSQ